MSDQPLLTAGAEAAYREVGAVQFVSFGQPSRIRTPNKPLVRK